MTARAVDLDAAIAEAVAEYRRRWPVTQRTRAGLKQFTPPSQADIHAVLLDRGIKVSKSTVGRRLNAFFERERASFDLNTWIDEAYAHLEALKELNERMLSDRERDAYFKVLDARLKISTAFQTWALERARHENDDGATVARLVRYSTDSFIPEDRAAGGPRLVRPREDGGAA